MLLKDMIFFTFGIINYKNHEKSENIQYLFCHFIFTA